jgi:hypothetical protein
VRRSATELKRALGDTMISRVTSKNSPHNRPTERDSPDGTQRLQYYIIYIMRKWLRVIRKRTSMIERAWDWLRSLLNPPPEPAPKKRRFLGIIRSHSS